MASDCTTTMYSAPLEPMDPGWPNTKRHQPVFEPSDRPWPDPQRLPSFQPVQPAMPLGIPEQCMSRLANLRSERAALTSRLPVLDAEIETLEKMLAAIGVAP